MIHIVNESEKYKKIKQVIPNIMANRLDIRHNENFELLEVKFDSKIFYIPFYIENNRCFLSVYMIPINKKIFKQIVNFIKKKYKVYDFHVGQSLNCYNDSFNQVHWLLKLPNNIEEYEKKFSKKSLYNRRRELNILEKKFEVEFCYCNRKELTTEIIDLFLQWKKEKGNCYKRYNTSYMLSKNIYITDTYILKLDGKIAAIILYSSVDNKTLYCENMAFDENYSKFQIGNLLFYYSIKSLIERGFKEIFLGGDYYKYKENCKAIKSETKSGNFNALTFQDKLFNILTYPEKYVIYLAGIKFSFKK